MPDASCHVTKSVGHECPSYGGQERALGGAGFAGAARVTASL